MTENISFGDDPANKEVIDTEGLVTSDNIENVLGKIELPDNIDLAGLQESKTPNQVTIAEEIDKNDLSR